MTKAAIALGSNIGDREAYLKKAVESLALHPQIRLLDQSSIYETVPVGYTEQDDFLNMVILIQTDLVPHDLLMLLGDIEKQHGRTRDIHWGPRTLDLDLLYYGTLILDSQDLQIPHPRMQDRAFVLMPLCDIAPDWRHPKLGLAVSELTTDVTGKDGIRRWK